MTFKQLQKLKNSNSRDFWAQLNALSDKELLRLVRSIRKERPKAGLEFYIGTKNLNRYLELKMKPMVVTAQIKELHALTFPNFDLVIRGYQLTIFFSEGWYRFPEQKRSISESAAEEMIRSQFPSIRKIEFIEKRI